VRCQPHAVARRLELPPHRYERLRDTGKPRQEAGLTAIPASALVPAQSVAAKVLPCYSSHMYYDWRKCLTALHGASPESWPSQLCAHLYVAMCSHRLQDQQHACSAWYSEETWGVGGKLRRASFASSPALRTRRSRFSDDFRADAILPCRVVGTGSSAETVSRNYKKWIMLSTAIWHPPVIDHLGLTPRCAEGREGGSWCEANAIDRA